MELTVCEKCGAIHPWGLTCDDAVRLRLQAVQKAEDMAARGQTWLNRLVNWRSAIIGRLVGTKPLDEPTKMARELLTTLLSLRAEVNALTHLYVTETGDAGVRLRRFKTQLEIESQLLCEAYERQFPGLKASDEGLIITRAAIETMKDWPK